MRGVACLEAAKMAGGFVLQWRGMAWFGALWRGLGRVELKSGRKGAEGAKKTRGGGWVLWAHIGPTMGPGVLRVWDDFCAPERGDVGFCREKWG